MKTTRTLPTDKNGRVYYGPKTFWEAKALIDGDHATAQAVVKMLIGAGYKSVAARIKKDYLS